MGASTASNVTSLVTSPSSPSLLKLTPPISTESNATPAVLGLSSHSNLIVTLQLPVVIICVPLLLNFAVPFRILVILIEAFVSPPSPSFNLIFLPLSLTSMFP